MCNCKQPAIRIADSGRIFCATCKRYLDRYQTTPETLRGDLTDETSIAPSDATDPGEGPLTSGVDNHDPHAR